MTKHAITAALAIASVAAVAGPSDTNCMWVQAYTDTKLASCRIGPDGMLLVPKGAINQRVGKDLLLTAAVATGMQRAPQRGISVALEPSLKTYLRAEGDPVEFRSQQGKEGEARVAFEAQIVSCELKANLQTSCSDGKTSKLKPID